MRVRKPPSRSSVRANAVAHSCRTPLHGLRGLRALVPMWDSACYRKPAAAATAADGERHVVGKFAHRLVRPAVGLGRIAKHPLGPARRCARIWSPVEVPLRDQIDLILTTP